MLFVLESLTCSYCRKPTTDSNSNSSNDLTLFTSNTRAMTNTHRQTQTDRHRRGICSCAKTGITSLDFVVNQFLMKLLRTTNMQLIEICCEQFNCVLPSIQLASHYNNSVCSPVTMELAKCFCANCLVVCLCMICNVTHTLTYDIVSRT